MEGAVHFRQKQGRMETLCVLAVTREWGHGHHEQRPSRSPVPDTPTPTKPDQPISCGRSGFITPYKKIRRQGCSRGVLQAERAEKTQTQPTTTQQKEADKKTVSDRQSTSSLHSPLITTIVTTASPKTPPTPPMTSPTILGHQNHSADTLNTAIPITPTKLDGMFVYWENPNQRQQTTCASCKDYR